MREKSYAVSGLGPVYEASVFSALLLMISVVPCHPRSTNRRKETGFTAGRFLRARRRAFTPQLWLARLLSSSLRRLSRY